MKNQSGFTVIEALVTVIVAVIFILSINTLFVTVIRSTTSARNRANASTTAYSYLRQYAYTGAQSDWFICNTSSDMQQNAAAPGQTIPGANGSLDGSQTSLPQPVTYSVVGLAPYGCSAPGNKSPILVRATVVYGPDHLSVDHATYIGRLQ